MAEEGQVRCAYQNRGGFFGFSLVRGEMEAVFVFHTFRGGERGTDEKEQADDSQPDNDQGEEEHNSEGRE